MKLVDRLNREYEDLHTKKEDAFWMAYMGLSADPDAARARLDELEVKLKRFLSDPERLAGVRAEIERVARNGHADEDERIALRGWERTFAAHAIESKDARALVEEIVADEGALARARGTMRLGYEKDGDFVEASSVRLAVMIANDPDEEQRRAAWNGLRSIEPHVLANGFVELVKKRNDLGRKLGGEDYYDATVRRHEGMSKADVFGILGELEERTRAAGERLVEELRDRHGAESVTPWNMRYFVAGDVAKAQDPYFPFASSVERWGRSFAGLGIGYRGAELVLDLVDRKGKYENGFMHGPVPAWRDRDGFRPARIQFTANAIPGAVGAGQSATRTLFHEGGHAAHFANIDRPAPCFSQEFAPTSVAFAETQSMFLDSLLGDADWQSRYARTRKGEQMPFELIERGLRARQPSAAWSLRAMLSVCYAEKAIYEIPDDQLSAESILETIRGVEQRLLFLDEGSPRPTLSVPHLLAGESSAYYHGYVLAETAVQQTREYFLERDGHLVDNPRIGPDLRRAYWEPGNERSFLEYVEELTGRPLGAEAIARSVNRTADEAVAEARARVDRLDTIPPYEGDVELEAMIRIMHGNETVSELDSGGFAAFAGRFQAWIDDLGETQPG